MTREPLPHRHLEHVWVRVLVRHGNGTPSAEDLRIAFVTAAKPAEVGEPPTTFTLEGIDFEASSQIARAPIQVVALPPGTDVFILCRIDDYVSASRSEAISVLKVRDDVTHAARDRDRLAAANSRAHYVCVGAKTA